MTGLLALMAVAFLAATPVPANSEVVFLGLQAAGWPMLTLVAAASLANTAGSCVTYAMGRGAETFRDRRWFPLTPDRLARAQGWWGRWGLWSLLLSWAPGGDVIVALAGLMRVPFAVFLALVALAKTARYLALAAAGAGLLGAAS
ncbi:DedA family protein [Rhodobacter sp. Har01]|uniref:YqaA family protein n=1 Tax=Rhodobacter sp. Har01 TaxID=2883999 RepID=UPI001D07E967|nr:YqaA family protein [Rhodobacter sp. Har01]MCB6177671.1 DedA family protein [Rhodobacter sp. Har01]